MPPSRARLSFAVHCKEREGKDNKANSNSDDQVVNVGEVGEGITPMDSSISLIVFSEDETFFVFGAINLHAVSDSRTSNGSSWVGKLHLWSSLHTFSYRATISLLSSASSRRQKPPFWRLPPQNGLLSCFILIEFFLNILFADKRAFTRTK